MTRFAALEPRVKNISQETIRKKWKPLPAVSQDKVRQILLHVKAKRSGARAKILKGPKPRKAPSKTQTKSPSAEDVYESMVETVAEKLLSRLDRMPFPPHSTKAAGDDSPFDLSATLRRIAGLRNALDTNRQSALLMQRQIRRERRALARDRAELERLETALKNSSSLRRKRERGMHEIVREHGEPHHDGEIARSLSAACIRSPPRTMVPDVAASFRPTTFLDDTAPPDPKLDSVVAQLRSHLVSMQNNISSMQPVMEAVEDVRMALDLFTERA